jgi:tyrosine-protein phosphatase SIW14
MRQSEKNMFIGDPLKNAAVIAFLVGAMALVSPIRGQSQDQVSANEIHNFHRVSPTLYRGAQPSGRALNRLKALGIRTILNLRAADVEEDREERLVRSLGMKYVNIPMKRVGRPDNDSISHALAVIESSENQPVFVHCQHGSDRTGSVVAIYRIKHDGWTAKQAIQEAEKFGMKFWERGMKAYIRDYEESQQSKSAK